MFCILNRGPNSIERRGNSVKSLGRVTFAILAGFAASATAQDVTGRSDGVPTCKSLSSASRTRADCGEEEQTVIRIEREVDVFVEAVELRTKECAIDIALDFYQRDTIARIFGVIENETCAASKGSYEIEARVKHENGDTETLVFAETWQREDDKPVEFTADYAIGENVELTRLRSRGLRCTCSDVVERQDDQTSVSQ